MKRNITINIEKLVDTIVINAPEGISIDDLNQEINKKIINTLNAAVNTVKDIPDLKTKREETYEAVYNILEPRLNQIGDIHAKDAWHLCRGQFSYSAITVAFKEIMYTMIEQGKATKIKNGHYSILARNIKSK